MHQTDQSTGDWTNVLGGAAERVVTAAYVAYLLGCALNALFIGGAPMAMIVGYEVLGGLLRLQLLTVGLSGAAAEVVVVLFAVLFWVVTTVPGFRVWDA